MTRRPKRLTSPLMGRWEPARPTRLAFQAAELLVANAASTGAAVDRATLRTLREGQFWQRRDADVRAMGPALARRAVRELLGGPR